MDRKHIGACSELVACVWLLRRGYEVFRNVSPHGEVDIVAFKDGRLFKFDVKTLDRPEQANLSKEQVEHGIAVLAVIRGESECVIVEKPKIRGRENPELKCDGCGKKFTPRYMPTNGRRNWCGGCRAIRYDARPGSLAQ